MKKGLAAVLFLAGCAGAPRPEGVAKAQAPAPVAAAPAAQATASGLGIVDQKIGTGPEATPGHAVVVHYSGWLQSNHKEFDSSYSRNKPFEFQLGGGQVIQGWEQGVAGMKVGGKRSLTIPPSLGYGSREVGGGLIPPNSTLLFDVELLEVK
jgi:FKBP-type peptidyl-prolyl cis-trans isomerase